MINLVMKTVVHYSPEMARIFPKEQFSFENPNPYKDSLPSKTERASFPIFNANENKYSDLKKIYDVNEVSISFPSCLIFIFVLFSHFSKWPKVIPQKMECR